MSASFDSKFIKFDKVSGSTLLTDLFAYWKFEESSGTLDDAVGSSNSTAASANYSQTGIISNCLSFTSGSQYITIPNTGFTVTRSSNYSISLWFNTTDIADTGYRHFMGDASNGWELFLYGGESTPPQYEFGWYTVTANAPKSNYTTLSANTWYHLVMTKTSAGVITFYLNNSNIGGATEDSYTSLATSTNTIGGWSGGNSFDGRIDEVGFWTKVLSASEISELYNSGAGKTHPFS